MKKIGFVDFYLSEWHANNYPEWIKNACRQLGADYGLAYAWAELDISPLDGVSSAEWCAKNGAELCGTLEELCEKSDVIIILAPSDPEKHLGYASVVLKYGKRTYIDKTFAPDLATAEQIFAISEKYATPFFSSSALRYADELSGLKDVCTVMTTGGGSNLPEYIIHQCEMVVKLLGVGADSVSAEKQGTQTVLTVSYPDGRGAKMTYAPAMPFTAYTSGVSGDGWCKIDSDFFTGLIKDMVSFFESGKVSFDTKQTLEVMKLRELSVKAASAC